ncbi:MAG: RNA polymerase sigma factor [Phycisphaerae bacterium]|nr:RNA polymerase sigma factor [Phycisphaerae bacterium]
MADSTGQNEDIGILRRLRSGDGDAFAWFIKKYAQQVFLCCRTVGLDADEAEDVASETFFAAYKGIGKYAGRSKLGTWLWKITYNKAIGYIRQKSCRQKHLRQLQNEYTEPEFSVLPVQETEIVWDAVKKLPPDMAMAIVLYYRQDKSIKEIADIMKKRQNTVKIYLFRGREKLKEILNDKIEGF